MRLFYKTTALLWLGVNPYTCAIAPCSLYKIASIATRVYMEGGDQMSYDPYDPNSKIPEEALPGLVIWPEKKWSAEEIRTIFNKVKRFIDMDKTLQLWRSNGEDEVIWYHNPTLRGKPIAEYLAEEPYVVHTWGKGIAVPFFIERYTHLPKPLFIFDPPPFVPPPVNGKHLEPRKHFAELRITGATIIDDKPAEEIYAPGCIILPPN